MTPSLLVRLDARDRALFSRLVLDARESHRWYGLWTAVTHFGGGRLSVGLCLVVAGLPGVPVTLVWRALVALTVSHLIVQLVKRSAVRERPSVRLSLHALVSVPDRFSFPSGHACAAMSVAAVFAPAFPRLSPVLFAAAMVVGVSRVVLGAHYPGDVLVGQLIAMVTAYVTVQIL